MSQPKKTNVDRLIDALEEMIDARDDMWEEEKYCNYRQMNKIRDERYSPAKDDFKIYLKKIIKEVSKKD